MSRLTESERRLLANALENIWGKMQDYADSHPDTDCWIDSQKNQLDDLIDRLYSDEMPADVLIQTLRDIAGNIAASAGNNDELFMFSTDINQALSDLKETKTVRLTLGRLFEQLLREDKTRFVKKAVDAVKADPETGAFLDADDTIEKLTKFVNSGAADKYKINWQEKDGLKLYQQIDDAYTSWQSAGGSRKEKAAKLKADVNQLFKSSGLKVVDEGADTSSKDMVILTSLENDSFVFVMPLNWQACVWIDSFKCGGSGARWCIGYEQDDSYWDDYTGAGDIFILAFSKKEYASPVKTADKLKYMIELPSIEQRGYNDDDWTEKLQAWLQSDQPDQTISGSNFKSFFGHTPDELLTAALIATGSDQDWIQDCWQDQIDELMDSGEFEETYYDLSKVEHTDFVVGHVGYEGLVNGLRWLNNASPDYLKDKTITLDFDLSMYDFSGTQLEKTDEFRPVDVIDSLMSEVPGLANVEKVVFKSFKCKKMILNAPASGIKLPPMEFTQYPLINEVYVHDEFFDALKTEEQIGFFGRQAPEVTYAWRIMDADEWYGRAMHHFTGQGNPFVANNIVVYQPRDPAYKDGESIFEYLSSN